MRGKGRPTRQVVPATLNEQQLALKLRLQLFQRSQVGRDVLANSSMGTSSRLDGAYTVLLQRLITDEKLLVFTGENVVGDGSCGSVVLDKQWKGGVPML